MGGYCNKQKLVIEPNSPLAYDPGLELYHPIMSTLGEHIGQFYIYICIYIYIERERERERNITKYHV